MHSQIFFWGGGTPRRVGTNTKKWESSRALKISSLIAFRYGVLVLDGFTTLEICVHTFEYNDILHSSCLWFLDM